MKRGVLFDLDETLIERKISLLEYAKKLHCDYQDKAKVELESFVKLTEELDGNGRAPREVFFQGLKEHGLDIPLVEIEQHFLETAWLSPVLCPGALDLLEALKSADIPTGIVSNGRGVMQRSKIENSGISPYIDAVRISAEFGVRKPEKQIFTSISDELEIDPSRSWFVGDDPVADVVGASEVGFRTVWLEKHLPWPEGVNSCYDFKLAGLNPMRGILGI